MPNGPQASFNTVDQQRAISIAKKEALEIHGWDRFVVGNVRRNEDTWRVVLWRTPSGPGTFATVVISSTDGKVIEWLSGL